MPAQARCQNSPARHPAPCFLARAAARRQGNSSSKAVLCVGAAGFQACPPAARTQAATQHRIRPLFVIRVVMMRKNERRSKGGREGVGVCIRTAGDATSDDACHRYARIEKLGLLLGLDFDARELSHLAHFGADLL